MCLATSKDGRTWQRPDLGLVEYNGSRSNNLVDLMGGRSHVTACTVFHEPDDPDPERRFKMMFHDWDTYDHEMAVEYRPGTALLYKFDTLHRGTPVKPGGARFTVHVGLRRAAAECLL